MDFRFSSEDAALQREAVEFVRCEWTPHLYDTGGMAGAWHSHDPARDAAVKTFEKKLVQKGWWTMHWPQEHGGKAAGVTTQLAYREAMTYAGAPATLGGGFFAPALMIHGQQWQKEYFLPRIANADIDFGQGFSEPNAGSDLAGLQTRAVRDGDDYVLNGQKIWSCYHHPWMHILVRTDPSAPKHRGISYLLIPARDDRGDFLPGITVRPVYNALGRHMQDELFLEDVRVPANTVVGEVNRGFYAAMTTLSFERSYVEAPASVTRVIEEYVDYCREKKEARGQSPLDQPAVRYQLANWRVEAEAMRMLSYRVAWMQAQGLVPQKEASMTKVWGAALFQGVYRFLSRSLGDYGTILPGADRDIPIGGYLNARAFISGTISVAGGTSEIQRNIIAQRGLGLPR